MIGIPLAILYTNLFEWFVHKYVLHGLGKRRESFWSFHWHEHHRESRRHGMVDAQYDRRLFVWGSPQLKEAASVVFAALLHLPLFWFAPWFAAVVFLHAARYYWLHRKAHTDPAWARQHLAVHYDHHMGKDQNANWCVTHPWFDFVMGTRKKYVYDETGKPIAEEAVPAPRSFLHRLVRPFFRAA